MERPREPTNPLGDILIEKDALAGKERSDPKHQRDADRRDQAMARRDVLGKTSKTLPPRTKPGRNLRKTRDTVDVRAIRASYFEPLMEDPENELFSASLAEIDANIADRQYDQQDPLEKDEADLRKAVDEALPERYREFRDVFSHKVSDTLPPHRKKADHRIELTGDLPATRSPLYRMSLNELTALKRYLADNLSKGFIVPSDAPYTSPVLFVKKKDQSLRFCIDYRKLNSITRKDGYPLPLIDETLQEISKAKVMTKLDIRQAFHRIRMAEGSEDLTTFRTRYGSYKCKVLPFGLTNGPATFQRYMNEVLFEFLDDFCTVFMDDILIYSANEEEHQQHVRKVLRRLREAGLTADIRKCEFHVTQTRFLGFIVSTNGIAPDPAKISVMASWGRPNTVRGVLSFLGVCNFYRRFVKNYGRIARPLQKLTRKNIPFRWTAKCEAAFEKLKTAMVTAPVLMYYDPTLKTRIETDASDGVVAGQMLQLFPDGEWHPIAYYSCAMDEHEMNYDIHDKEMLAVITALREWRSELVCLPEPFLIVTDHKAPGILPGKTNIECETGSLVRCHRRLSLQNHLPPRQAECGS
jgi:hypothetical protein